MADHPAEPRFDVFLSHNRLDKPAVIRDDRGRSTGFRLALGQTSPGVASQGLLVPTRRVGMPCRRAAPTLRSAERMGSHAARGNQKTREN